MVLVRDGEDDATRFNVGVAVATVVGGGNLAPLVEVTVYDTLVECSVIEYESVAPFLPVPLLLGVPVLPPAPAGLPLPLVIPSPSPLAE